MPVGKPNLTGPLVPGSGEESPETEQAPPAARLHTGETTWVISERPPEPSETKPAPAKVHVPTPHHY